MVSNSATYKHTIARSPTYSRFLGYKTGPFAVEGMN